MSHEPPSQSGPRQHRSLLERLSVIFHTPTREDFIDTLHEANEQKLIDDNALQMMEGVMRFSNLRACDLMVPRSQIQFVDLSEPQQEWLPRMVETEHSRFPVIADGDRDNILGILHAKVLLHLLVDPNFQAKEHLRAVKYIPESMPLDELLRDFKLERNHMAIVVDEFGCVSGLITIEDVLEQIVGEIDDEFDEVDEDADNILEDAKHSCWRVKALTEIEQFDAYFDTRINEEEGCHCETIGGLIADRLEHMPKTGESVVIGAFRFTVLRADERQVRLLKVERVTPLEELIHIDEKVGQK